MRARYEPGIAKIGFQVVSLRSGQFIFGRLKAARDLDMSEWKIRQCISFLKTSGNITIKTTNKYSVITIVNWEIYQGMNNGEPPTNPPTTRQQPATIKKGKKDKEDGPPFEKIIAYLNKKVGKNFRHTTKATRSYILARWNEGFRVADFRKVIDVKRSQWIGDPKMRNYLRPQTLFGTNFDSYLNEDSLEQGPESRVPYHRELK